MSIGTIVLLMQKPAPDIYTVAIDFIPNQVNPRNIRANIELFIATQLYYPLISVDGRNEISSHFLNLSQTKPLDGSFKKYIFCVKEGISFSDGQKITLGDITSAIQNNRDVQYEIASIQPYEQNSLCTLVVLNKPDAFFLHKFNSIYSSPIKNSDDRFLIGLGPYRVTKFNNEEIEFEKTPSETVGQFKRLKFILASKLPHINSEFFVDKNHISNQKQKKEKMVGMSYIQRPSQKTYAVVVNYENAELTKLFSRCFSRLEFASIQAMPLIPLPGFIPEGILGADVYWKDVMRSVPSKECQVRNVAPIKFYHYEKSNFAEVEKFFKMYRDKLPIPVSLERKEIKEIIASSYKDKNIATLIGFDTAGYDTVRRAEVMTYFLPFIKENRSERLVANINKRLLEIFKKAINLPIDGNIQPFAKEAHKELLISGQVIPLGELEIQYEYPKQLENIVWLGRGSGISGYPDISKMEWKSWWKF